MALSEERRRQLEEAQRNAVRNNLRAAAEADAATFDRLEQQRAETQRYNQIIQQRRAEEAAVAQARQQARQQAQYDWENEFQTNFHDYRAQDIDTWKRATQSRRELENAQKYINPAEARTNARENLRRANAMKDYAALRLNATAPEREIKPDEDEVPMDPTGRWDYAEAKRRYDDTIREAETRAYRANKALESDIPKIESVMDTEARHGTQDSAKAIAGMVETGGQFDPKRNYFGADKATQAKLVAQAVYRSVTGGVPDPTHNLNIDTSFMTDPEKAVVLKMAYAGEWDALYEYVDNLRATLDARNFDAQQQRIANMSKAGQTAYGMTGSFVAPFAYAQMGIDTLTGNYTDQNAGFVAATRLASEARTRSLENASPVGRFMGNVAYSMADNLVTLSLGQTGALIWLGLSAAGNEGVSALENGATQRQAFAKATASGLIETATEKMGIDNLFDIALKSGSRGIKSMLLDIAKQFGSEGAEEIISEFAGTFADKAIMGQRSEYNQAIRQYEANGLSHDEAVKRANIDFFAKNPALAGLAGAVSGALFGVGGVTVQQGRTARADLASGREITDTRRVADVVLDEGMKSTDKRIRDMAYNLDAIRRENERSDGFQWSAADQRRIGEIYDSLDTAARRRVLEADKYREAQRQAAESKEIKAREAVLQAEQDEKARSEAQQRLDEMEAETDRMMEDAETVDLDSMEAEEAADNTTRRGSDEYTVRVETAEDVDADMRRRAAAAEEATRTGDRSALDNLDQPRRTTESSAQTNRQTAQQEPVNPTQQRRDMKKLVREVYSSMGITSEVSVGEIADAMQEAYNTIAKEGSNTEAAETATNALLQVAQEHFEEDMLRQAEEDRDRQFGTEDEVYTQARKTIRGTRLYVPQSLNASELGVDSLNEFRRANFGVLNLTRDNQAMPIDTFYDELVREYPGLFPAPDTEGGPTSEADMLRTIAEVYRSRGNTMQAEPIDTNAIRREAQQKAFGVLSNAVVQAQQAYNNAQNAARESADQIAQKTAENARKAGLSNEETLVMSNVARDLGVNLQFQKMKYDIVNGFYDRKSNTIVLNQNLSTAEKAWTTFAHEITHAAETAGSYNQLRDVAKQYGMKGATDEAWRLAVDEQRRDYLKAGVKLSKDEAEFELVANTIQKILGSREAMEGVVQYSREDAQALLSSVDNVADRVTTNNTAITPEAARLVQAQKALAAALGEVQEQNRYGADNAAQGQKVQYSLETEVEKAIDDMSPEEIEEALGIALRKLGLTDIGVTYNPDTITDDEVADKKTIVKNIVRDTVSEFDPTIYNGKLYVKPQTLDFWLSSGGFASTNPNYAQAYITTMNPADFLRMTTATEENQRRVLSEARRLDENELSENAMRQPIQLEIDEASGKVIGHEGRHRAVALARAGVTEMPVLLFDSSTKYDKTAKSEMTLRGQNPQFDDTIENGNELTFRDVIPLSKGNADTIRERFTASAADRVNAKESGKRVLQYSVEGVDVDDIYRRALEKYGKMRSGEQLVDKQGNPVTQKVDMANAYSEGMKARSLYRTAAEANNVTVDVKTRAVLDQYKPTSNQENVDRANEMRSKYSNFDKAYGAWQDMVDKGLSSRYGVLSNQIAFAETLMMEAQKEGRSEDALNILSDLAQFGTTAGQAVQALSLIKRLSPEGQLMHYKRVVENFANSGKKGKTPADVQTAMQTIEINEDLLNKLEELRKLKRFETNNGKMTEAVARRIAELEKEIEALQTKLAPQLEKYNRLVQEKNATTLERNKLKREEKTLPKNIKDTEERIKNLRAEIDDLNNELEPKRMELQAKLADEDLAKEERNKAKKELDAVNRKIKAAQKRINNLRAEIQTYFDEMPLRTMKLHEMLLYERYLASAKEVMDIYLRYTKNKGGNVKVPENLQVEYLDAKTEEEREAVRKKMDIAIADQLPGTWSEKIRGWRYISMLFNPTTHFRNLTGNAVQYGLKGMRDTLAAGMERLFIRGKGERTKAIANRFLPADRAYFDAARADYNIIEDDLKAGGKASETQGIENARKIYGNKYAEAVRRFSGDLLENEDKIFLRANYTQSFAEYLKANKIDPANMTDEQKERARQIAFQQALEATYRDASTIASVLSNLEKQGAGWEFALGGIMPFKKTPVNVLKRGVEYSPAGIIKATYDMIQATRGKNAKTKSDIIGEYASGLTGTIVAALGMFAARAGIAFASPGDDDKDRKKAMDEATGQQDYAIKFNIGGKEWTYTFDWVAPASMAFFAGVRAYEAWRGKEDFSLQAALDGLITTINPVFELSMLDGLAGMFKSYASDEAGTAAAVAWSILESYALQFFPTVGGKLARAIDPYQRSTYSPKDSAYTKNLERLYRRAMAKIPGASYMLEPVIDQYGNLKENIGKNFIGRLGYNLTSPGYIKPVTHYAADEEMKRLYAQVGETSVLPKETPTSWDFNGETYYLDSAEYRKWGERQGKYVYDELDKLYQTPEYKAANDTKKAKMVEKVINAGTEYAKMGFFEDIGLIDDYYRHTLDGLVYDDTQGYRQYKTIPEATEIYEQGRIDLKTVYDANETLKGISGNAARIDAMNKMNLDSDEYNFLYMTKIASNEMEADISAVINAGGSLDSAINIVSQFYKWDANAENKTTGEKGAWVSIGNGAKAEVLAQSNMTLPAIETMYLRVLTPTDDVEKQTELINEFKSAGKNIKDYLNTKAVLYDGGVSKYKKTSDIAQAFLDSDLPDDLKELGYKTLGSDAQGVPEEIAAFKKARMTIDDYLRTKAVVGKTDAKGNGLKNYEKARELLKMDLKSYTTAITSVITSSENQATGIQNCLNVGISDRKVAEGYAKYAEINANDALNATQKATEFSKWLNTDKSMSNLTTAQKDMMRASFVYFMMTPASAGRYDSFMKIDGMRSSSAESLASDLAALEPLPGAKSVSDAQRRHAVAYNSTASEKEIDSAMYLLLDSTDDGKEATGLANYKMARAAGLTAKQYVDYSEKLGTFSSDRDANGKEITGHKKQDKIVAYINGLPISRAQKNALWFLAGYKESTLKKQPWY